MSLLFSLLFSVSSFACPIYNATFECNYNGGTEEMTLTTRIENGVYIYNYNNELDLIADGLTRPFHYSEDFPEIAVSCKGETLSLNLIRRDLVSDVCAANPSRYDYTVNWINEGNNIKEHNTGVLSCASGEVFDNGYSNFNCRKIN